MTREPLEFDAVVHAADRCHLDIIGVVLPTGDDPVPAGTKAVVLLGPQEPGYWAYVTAQPELRTTGPIQWIAGPSA